jgi:adenylate cyclase class 2
MTDNIEREVRFLDIDKESFVKKLQSLGAIDLGDDVLEEIIFYDKDNTWPKQNRLVKLRGKGKNITLTYKHRKSTAIDGTEEIEVTIDNIRKAALLLERAGLSPFRQQEKKRHSFKLNDIRIDIDTWPGVPTYAEIEAPTNERLKEASQQLGFDWSKANSDDVRDVLLKKYDVPLANLRVFTFSRIE